MEIKNFFTIHKLAVTAIAIVAVVIVWNAGSYFYLNWKEGSLIKKYADEPDKKSVVDQIKINLDDLSKNPDKPKKIGATMDMGLQWYNLLEYDLAARWWSRGLKIEPNNDIGWYNLGNAYRAMREYRAAREAYYKSMEYTQPGEIDACLALGEMYKYDYKVKKDSEDNIYRNCLVKHPNNRDLIAHLAGYYRDIGNIDKALYYFDKLFSIDPSPEVSEEIRDLQIKKQNGE